jgi:hypothetical protein
MSASTLPLVRLQLQAECTAEQPGVTPQLPLCHVSQLAETMNLIFEAWPPAEHMPSQEPGDSQEGLASSGQGVLFSPYCRGFLGSQVVQLLLGNAIDSWDKLRQVRL